MATTFVKNDENKIIVKTPIPIYEKCLKKK